LEKMKKLFDTDLAVIEGRRRLHGTTLNEKGASALTEILASGSVDRVVSGGGAPGPGARKFESLRIDGRGYRVLGGSLEGPRSPAGETYSLLILLEDQRIEGAKRRAVIPVAGAAIVGILVVLATGWLVATSFTGRLKGLSDAAERIASGDTGGRVEAGGGDELGRFAGAFNRMVEALAESRDRVVHSERMAALGKLASAMAHEIRNPLTSIRMTAEILLPDQKGEESQEALELLLRELKRLELFLEEILTLSGGLALKVEETRLKDLTGEVLALLGGRLSHMGIEARDEVEGDLRFPLDGDRIKQVLVNLVLNGAQAAGPGGEVSVRAQRTAGGALEIDVVDTGSGVEPEAREKLFEPFFTTKQGGTGLGLAVSRRIVEAHGGKIGCQRGEGRTVFTVEIPPGYQGGTGLSVP
jgi:signal transduction histidine kinase